MLRDGGNVSTAAHAMPVTSVTSRTSSPTWCARRSYHGVILTEETSGCLSRLQTDPQRIICSAKLCVGRAVVPGATALGPPPPGLPASMARASIARVSRSPPCAGAHKPVSTCRLFWSNSTWVMSFLSSMVFSSINLLSVVVAAEVWVCKG